MSHDVGFAPTVRCPYCNHVMRPQFTGWGRTGLNVRYKSCFKCGETFSLSAYIFTSKDDITDGTITAVKNSIDYYKKHRKERFKEMQAELEREKQITHGQVN